MQHARGDAVLQGQLNLSLARLRIDRFFKEHLLHIGIDTLHTFIKFTSPAEFD